MAVRRTASDWRVIGIPKGSVGIAICAATAVSRVIAGTLRKRRVARSIDCVPVRVWELDTSRIMCR